MKILLAFLAALLLATPASADTIEWRDGLWFDGNSFVPGTRWTVGDVFVARSPKRVDRVVNLGKQYVVPAFGDAHHHGIDSAEGLDLKIDAFLEAGIFYVKNPNVIADLITPEVRVKLNRASSIDVAFSNGGLTSSGGHPAPLQNYLASIGVFPGLKAEDMENRAYFFIDSEAGLDAKWPRILAGKPDFIKAFIGFSDHGAENRMPPYGYRGLDPKLLPAVARKAHGSGLRISAHIDTATDFRNAVAAGVDEINHLPSPDPRFSPDLSAYVIDEATAKLAAERGIVVVTTASTTERLSGGALGEAWVRGMRENQVANLKTLRAAGVRLAIGSDGISGERTFATARDEVRFLAANKMLDNLTLLRMWSQETPRTIFPKRRLGALEPGYEADFLVLAGNPLEDTTNLERISMRVKSGWVLPPMVPVVLRRAD